MQQIVLGDFTLNYTLFTINPREVGEAFQFGMDFTVINHRRFPLCQLIFPATKVGNNVPFMWNVDNHESKKDMNSLVFSNAGCGEIRDTPREISSAHMGILTTIFNVFPININQKSVYQQGLKFGYCIDTNNFTNMTMILSSELCEITKAQKDLIINTRCSFARFPDSKK